MTQTHNEVIMLLVSFAVLIEIACTYKHLRRIPHKSFLFFSFFFFVSGAICTVAEGFLLGHLFNWIEHLSYMCGAISMTIWCGLVFGIRKQENP